MLKARLPAGLIKSLQENTNPNKAVSAYPPTSIDWLNPPPLNEILLHVLQDLPEVVQQQRLTAISS